MMESSSHAILNDINIMINHGAVTNWSSTTFYCGDQNNWKSLPTA